MTRIKNKIRFFGEIVLLWLFPILVFGQIIKKECEGSECTFANLLNATQDFIDFLMYTLTPPVAVLLFLWAGWIYLTAGPNPGKVSKAISIFSSVIVGILIMFSAWLIVHFITDSLLDDAFKGDPIEINLIKKNNV